MPGRLTVADSPRHNSHSLNADAYHLPDEPDDVFLVVRPVRVGRDAAAVVFAHLVLVDDPFQGAAVAEPIIERLGRDAGQGERRRSPRRLVLSWLSFIFSTTSSTAARLGI